MRTSIRRVFIIAGLAIAAAPLAPLTKAQEGTTASPSTVVKIGYLSCQVSSGWGLIFGSSRSLDCTYTPVAGKSVERYRGSITKFGADIGYLQSGVLLWTVVAPSTNTGPGALAGHYAGATASAAVGVGAGANILVGGMHSSISLQPISVEGQAGLNVAAGIANLSLEFDRPGNCPGGQPCP